MNNPAGYVAAAAGRSGLDRASEPELLIYGVRTRSVTCTSTPSLRATWRYRCWCFLIERSTPRPIEHLQPVPAGAPPASSERWQTPWLSSSAPVERVGHATSGRRTSRHRAVTRMTENWNAGLRGFPGISGHFHLPSSEKMKNVFCPGCACQRLSMTIRKH